MSTPQRIQRKRTKGWCMPEGAVYVGRPTKWGNPFTVNGAIDAGYASGPDEGRRLCVEAHRSVVEHGKYSEWWFVGAVGLLSIPARARTELAGRDLACWCPLDQPCHADVLLEIANGGAS